MKENSYLNSLVSNFSRTAEALVNRLTFWTIITSNDNKNNNCIKQRPELAIRSS